MNKPSYVTFGDIKIEKEFELLKEGKFEDKQLYTSINNLILGLKQNSIHGIKIPKYLWLKEYIKNYQVNNLWKYNLPNGWRLIYTIKSSEVMILNIILEWFSHKEYEKRFDY